MTKKLGNQITNSPIVSRARQRLEQPTKESSKGLFSFLSSTLIWRSKTKEKSNKNMFLDPRMHHNYDCCSATATTDHCVAHQFSDSGRIANRYDNSRWDVWTTMGENVLEYDGVLLDEEDDPYYEECSSSEDDFLEIPLNDRFFYKHWK